LIFVNERSEFRNINAHQISHHEPRYE